MRFLWTAGNSFVFMGLGSPWGSSTTLIFVRGATRLSTQEVTADH